MGNVVDLTANDILGIDITNPEKLFSYYDYVNQYRALAKKWHPDKHPTDPDIAHKVFSRISLLYTEAEKRIENNNWNGPSTIEFTSEAGKKFSFKYRLFHDIQIGKMYVGYKSLLYIIHPDYSDLYKNGIQMIESLKYPEKKFEDQFKRHFPTILEAFSSNIGLVLLLEKTDDLILFKDLLKVMPNNKLPAVHTAWLMSTLCNMACFLQMSKIAHGAILNDTVWVSPKHHSCVLLGGWFYARPDDSKLLALPQQSLSVLSSKIITDKKAKSIYDRTLIKSLGIESLGDSTRTGTMLLTDKSVPPSVLTWLRSPAVPNAIDEYKNWSTARDSGFGARKFIVLDVDPKQIY